jgi:transposase InsO family protein
MIPIGEAHVRKILREWTNHYNASRPHMSLGPGIPDPRVQKAQLQIERHIIPKDQRIVATPILGGLHHEYRLERSVA